MVYEYKVGKPKRKMKQVIKWLENCIFVRDCTECPYGENNFQCQEQLRTEALYYLRQTLERSSRGQDSGFRGQ